MMINLIENNMLSLFLGVCVYFNRSTGLGL